jgi:16S rRNA (cytosine1402-N4)-methyltransferase
MEERWPHQSVLAREVIEILQPHPGGCYVDATVGAGGHSFEILKKSSPSGLLLGIDQDPTALKISEQRLNQFITRITLKKGNFSSLDGLLQELGWQFMDGIIFDLGVSSMQIETPNRGFSFLKDGPLDMRFDPDGSISAAEFLNNEKEEEIARILWENGEEPKARQIAAAICRNRPLTTTFELAQIVASIYKGIHKRIHPATRTFQAIRMEVNQELQSLRVALEKSVQLLMRGGRLVVISFHSLEDRLVKQFIRRESQDCICPPEQPICTCGHTASLKNLTRHAVMPSEAEIKNNPRARSARLRAAEKIA